METHLRRNLGDWEIDELIDMLKTLEKYTTSPRIKDKMKWGNSLRKVFTQLRVKAWCADLCSDNIIIDLWPKLVCKTTFTKSAGWL